MIWDMNPSFSSNKPTHYLLVYGYLFFVILTRNHTPTHTPSISYSLLCMYWYRYIFCLIFNHHKYETFLLFVIIIIIVVVLIYNLFTFFIFVVHLTLVKTSLWYKHTHIYTYTSIIKWVVAVVPLSMLHNI